MRLLRPVLRASLVFLPALFLAGCATPELRKTPYYHTEPDPSPEAARDRIPGWPLLYYRQPTLEVLWPLFEKSDEFIALRPLGAISGLDQPEQTYSLLWPIGQFDRAEKKNRFFPMFWGEDYAVGFPLYWHLGHPFGPEGGTDGLIPLWWYTSHRQGYSFNILWPVLNLKDEPDGHGWRVWPLAGSYSRDADDYYRFALWPLAHQWGHGARRERGEAVLPLYLRLSAPGESMFLSLPYSRYRDADRQWDLALPFLTYHRRDSEGSTLLSPIFSQGESADQRRAWQLLLPLYYSSREEDRRTFVTLLGGMTRDADGMGWMAVPLLSGGTQTRDSSSTWLLGPLAHFGKTPETSSRHVFPFFYSSADSSGHTFLSLPWSSGSRTDGSEWQLIPPLMLRTSDGLDRRLLTPIYSAGTRGRGSESWQTVFPLWYRSQGADGGKFVTLAGGWETDPSGRSWLIWPLLSGGTRTGDARDLWIVAPLFHARRDEAGVSSHLLPLYWWDAHDKTLLSPAVATWSDPVQGGKTTVIPPALTLYSSEPKRKDLWTVGGAAHFSWGEEAGSSHVLPLYYRNASEGTFLSIPWSSWTWNRTTTNTLIAPALSWMTRRAERSDLWTLGPMAHFSWGKQAESSHVIPLFYRNQAEDTFISLPYSHWKNGEEEFDLYPPLLAMFSRDGVRRRFDALAGLFSETWGGDDSRGYFLPLYYHDSTGRFFSLLFGWDKGSDSGFFYPLTPLIGVRTGRQSGGWFFPFWSRCHNPDTKRTTGNFLWGAYRVDEERVESSLIPFYEYKNRIPAPQDSSCAPAAGRYGKTFWSLPAIWYRNQVEVVPVCDKDGKPTGKVERSFFRKKGFFPLWWYSQQTTPAGGDDVDGTMLLWLYNYRHTVRPQEEYVCRRFIWRAYYYERKNDDVSVDIFPGITYDSTHDGFKRWAWLGRVFRYERGPEGRKLDLLLVPLLRSGSGASITAK